MCSSELAIAGPVTRGCDQLQIVDDDQVEAMGALEAAGAGGQPPDRHGACRVDIKRQGLDLEHRVADFLVLGCVDRALADHIAGDAGVIGDPAHGELFGRHFQRAEADNAALGGFGRAVGETMIVLMATGNTPVMDFSIFQGMRTLSANIAVEMPESEVASTHFRVLFLAALVLFAFTFLFNTVAEIVRQRLRQKYSSL